MQFQTQQFARRPVSLGAFGNLTSRAEHGQLGITLIEVVMATAILALVFGGVLTAYMQSALRVEWTGYSLAAQSLAQQTVEQARSAVWDPAQTPPVNNLTNLNLRSLTYTSSNNTCTGYATNILDVPYSGNSYIIATNFVTIKLIYINGITNTPAESLQVQTVWPFNYRPGQKLLFTNTIGTLISPDNRDPSTF